MFSLCLLGLPAGPWVPPNKLALFVNDCLSLYKTTCPAPLPDPARVQREVGQMDSRFQSVQDFIYCVKVHHSQRKGLFTVHLPLIY